MPMVGLMGSDLGDSEKNLNGRNLKSVASAPTGTPIILPQWKHRRYRKLRLNIRILPCLIRADFDGAGVGLQAKCPGRSGSRPALLGRLGQILNHTVPDPADLT